VAVWLWHAYLARDSQSGLDRPGQTSGFKTDFDASFIERIHSDLIDTTQLSVERFAKGELLEETAVL